MYLVGIVLNASFENLAVYLGNVPLLMIAFLCLHANHGNNTITRNLKVAVVYCSVCSNDVSHAVVHFLWTTNLSEILGSLKRDKREKKKGYGTPPDS